MCLQFDLCNKNNVIFSITQFLFYVKLKKKHINQCFLCVTISSLYLHLLLVELKFRNTAAAAEKKMSHRDRRHLSPANSVSGYSISI